MHPLNVNVQDPEKRMFHPDGSLEVFKIWPTIQGEGPLVGWPAVFIRLAGCNLQCPACDTDYTSTRKLYTPEGVLNAVKLCSTYISHIDPILNVTHKKIANNLVVFTGGEPYRQNFFPAARLLLAAGYAVQVETNGTFPDPDPNGLTSLIVVCSPKTGSIHDSLHLNKNHVQYLKYVMHHEKVDPQDGLPTVALGGTRPCRPWPGYRGQVILQPEDTGEEETNKKNIAACVASCRKYGYRFGMQIHKYIGVE